MLVSIARRYEKGSIDTMLTKRLVHRILDLAAGEVPNALAATLGEETLTFREADRRANRTARALEQLGVGPGDRVSYWSGIAMRNLDVYFGILRRGATFVPMNPAFAFEEARAMVEYIRPVLLIVDRDLIEAGEEVAKACGVKLAVTGGGSRAVPGADLDALTERASDAAPPELLGEEEGLEAIFLTSGSTGKPKGVMVPHRATWTRAMEFSLGNITHPGGRGEISMFPMFHFAGWHFLLGPWAFRRAVHMPLGTDADTLLGMVERWRAGNLYCIPAVWDRILECRKPYDTRSLYFVNSGTSRVEPEMIARLRARFPGTYIGLHYGSTEMGRGLSIGDSDLERKPYAIGLSLQGVESKLVDGELWQRGISIAAGYFELPQQTADAFQDGWYLTGDLAEQDEEGYYTITGRRREIIRSGGETIAPAEVEAALADFPGVSDVAIVGMPDARWGEVICAALVLDEGGALPSVEALRAHLDGRLSAFKHPRNAVAVESLPRTPATGQIQRSQVRDAILNLDGVG